MKKDVRILLPSPSGDFYVVEIPRTIVAMSLFNDTEIPFDGSPKTVRIDEAWANGDGIEVVVRRVPKR